MNIHVLELLRCPSCKVNSPLSYAIFKKGFDDIIVDGVVWCTECNNWYPIEDELLELLPVHLSYKKDRREFWVKYSEMLIKLGLMNDIDTVTRDGELQSKQQSHFDWFAENDEQTYLSYEQTPFWRAADRIAFETWREVVSPGNGKWLLDVGSAQGRSTFKWMDLDLNIVAFDISKRMIRQAIDRYRSGNNKAKAVFFAADATRFPFPSECFDYILVYGVLHHLPNPNTACKEIARVLKPGGIYFGEENNQSAFRILFDLLQKIIPLWHEEAGPEHVFSSRIMKSYFHDTKVKINSKTSVFLPPHVFNLLSERSANILLKISDRVGQSIPFIRDNGGVILIQGRKE